MALSSRFSAQSQLRARVLGAAWLAACCVACGDEEGDPAADAAVYDGGIDASAQGDASPLGDAPSTVRDATPDAPPDASRDAGEDASTGDASPPPAEVPNLAEQGPRQVANYEVPDPAYASAVVYYPSDGQPPFGSVALSPGVSAVKEEYLRWGRMLASHGIVTMLITPTQLSDLPPARGEDLVAAVARLRAENDRQDSPLHDKLAKDRICLTGHSMGGGGTLFAAQQLGTDIRCTVPMEPYMDTSGVREFSNVRVPTLIITARADGVAVPQDHGKFFYTSIPAGTDKLYAEFDTNDHVLAQDRSAEFAIQIPLVLAFYKLVLQGREEYRPYVYGDQLNRSELSDFQFAD